MSPFSDTIPVYDKDRQIWTPFKDPDNETYYIGVDRDCSPADFKREDTLPGEMVELSFGDWEIPAANPLIDSCVLPFFELPHGDGTWYKEYKEQYKEASQLALKLSGELRENMLNTGDLHFEMDADDLRHHIAMMIGVNYDLTINEMAALRLFDQEKYVTLVFAFLDMNEQLAMMRITEATDNENPTEAPQDGNDTASGGADTSRTE
jgi:hypothetical protein